MNLICPSPIIGIACDICDLNIYIFGAYDLCRFYTVKLFHFNIKKNQIILLFRIYKGLSAIIFLYCKVGFIFGLKVSYTIVYFLNNLLFVITNSYANHPFSSFQVIGTAELDRLLSCVLSFPHKHK